MAKFEKHIVLSPGTGVGIGSETTTATTYGETSNSSYSNFANASYPHSTIYFEALMKVSAGTVYAALYDTSGSVVSGSEVTVTASSPTRVRSTAITVADGNYTVRLKVDSGVHTGTYYSSRIIVVQNASALSATETQIPLIGGATGHTSASYEDAGSIEWGWFRYTSANWDGTVAIYLDVTFKTSAGTVTVGLFDSANNLVGSSEVTTTSASLVRVRSSALSLSNATDFKIRIKTSAGTAVITDARVVIKQTGNPTKSESYITLLRSTTAASATGGTFQDSLHKAYYDSANWSVDSISWYHESISYANTGAGTMETYNLTGAARTTNSNITSTNNSVVTRYRSSALTMPTTQEITARVDSAAGIIYNSIVHLITVLVWTNVSSSGAFFAFL